MASQMGVIPAQLGFLAIFNPSLGTSDETLEDQILYYASVNAQSQHRRRHRSRGKATADISQEERNERLRQIGLAQGMIELSRGFAGEPVNTIETEKTRVILQEVEPGWWILASIDLTRIPLPPRIGSPTAPGKQIDSSEDVEYSSRELKPSALLIRDLLRAHSVFLLHHAPSLSVLFAKSKRASFMKQLGRFWDLFTSTWDVMLHGNPACAVFQGIKIAACGELGVGVGEEERGSGEREVLEGFVDRVDGLVDLVVSKFGSSESSSEAEPAKTGQPDAPSVPWLGTGEEPGAEDGAIFLGVGALSRKSLVDITCWMEDIYTWGDNAYGVKESPAAARQGKRRQKSTQITSDGLGGLAPPQDTASPASHGSTGQDATTPKPNESEPAAATVPDAEVADEGSLSRLMGYLRLGYGTHWTLGGSEDVTQTNTPNQSSKDESPAKDPLYQPSDTDGRFLIGLLGDVEESQGPDRSKTVNDGSNQQDGEDYNPRIPHRTLAVELQNLGPVRAQEMEDKNSQTDEADSGKEVESVNQDRSKQQNLRVVVYVNKPFIYTFLFRPKTGSLALDGIYRSLHLQLAPLRKTLAVSTTYRPDKPDVGQETSHIFDLVWDPRAMTVHSTIPSIPTPADFLRENSLPVWSRAEAISTHTQILNMYAATLTKQTELERTCKTSRGWWVVWTRLVERSGEDDASSDQDVAVGKEIFLIRRAGEHMKSGRSSYAENGSSWMENASRLAQGIGVDTHKYIEGLLSLSR